MSGVKEGGTQGLPKRAIGGRSAPAQELRPREGLRLGRYELIAPLGSGGMAEVWVGRLLGELGFSRMVAVKTIRPEYAEDPGFRHSFFEEARLAARLRHANLVETSDLGEQGPILFQVMEFIEGDTLGALVRLAAERGKRHVPPAIICRVISDALAGLHAAHEVTDEQGVPLKLVHRDVSPQNILVGIDGVARLSDFGVAKALGRLSFETEAGQIRGKPGYLSPEQLERKPLDRRVDLYAMGIVLWEAFTGARLFAGDKRQRALARPTDPTLPDVRIFAPGLPDALAELTMRALGKKPEDRHQTAREMRDALEAAARASDAIATSHDVSTFVGELCSVRIEELRAQLRNGPRAPAEEAKGDLAALAAAEVIEPAPIEPVPSLGPPPLPTKISPRPSLAAALRHTVGIGDARKDSERANSVPPTVQVTMPIAIPEALSKDDETEEMLAFEQAAGVSKSRAPLWIGAGLVGVGALIAVLSMPRGADEVAEASLAATVEAPAEPASEAPGEAAIDAPAEAAAIEAPEPAAAEAPVAPLPTAPVRAAVTTLIAAEPAPKAVERAEPAPRTVERAAPRPEPAPERRVVEAQKKAPERTSKKPLRPKFGNPYK